MVPLLVPLPHGFSEQDPRPNASRAKGVRFADLVKVCEANFGMARQAGSSYMIFKTPWPGDPRVNIQDDKGMAKAYQVRQVLMAIDRLKEEQR